MLKTVKNTKKRFHSVDNPTGDKKKRKKIRRNNEKAKKKAKNTKNALKTPKKQPKTAIFSKKR